MKELTKEQIEHWNRSRAEHGLGPLVIHAARVRSREPALPIPRDEWPMWAKALANRSRTEDKGVGDVAARFIGDERSEKFKAWYLVTFGKPCGCSGRQRQWNLKYPL